MANLTGEVFISRLQRENLFLVPLDGRGEWFRFHHLFQQHLFGLLQAQLDAAEIAALRRRASHWYTENGLLQDLLQYALRAGDVDAAVHPGRATSLQPDEHRAVEPPGWLAEELLPEDVLAQSPLLCSARAYLGLSRGPMSEMVTALQQAEQHFDEPALRGNRGPSCASGLAVIRSALGIVAGQPADVIANVQRSLEALPPQALHIRSIAVGT